MGLTHCSNAVMTMANFAAARSSDLTMLQLSPPVTTSPTSPSACPVADRASTPLGLFLDASSTVPAGRARPRDDPLALAPLAIMSPVLAASSPATVDASRLCLSSKAVAGPTGQDPDPGKYEPSSALATRDPVTRINNIMSPPNSNSDDSPLSDLRPLRTTSVREDTKIAHPKPMMRLSHAHSDPKIRSGSPSSNIAQLEATAERLSMTSSIDDAIRDLHSEMKRTDSRRSSILAASLRMTAADTTGESTGDDAAVVAVQQSRRHMSTSSSIVSTNIAARHGGYSPAAYVMSPAHSFSGRFRSGSRSNAGPSDRDFDSVLSRNGPGKTSGRSVPSSKMLLAEISKSDPVTLTQDVLDKADAAPLIEEYVDESALLLTQDEDMLTPHPLEMQQTPEAVFKHPVEDAKAGDLQGMKGRPESSLSSNTFQQCRDAFTDFDGVYWGPDQDDGLFAPALLDPDATTPRPFTADVARPKSYVDSDTGQQMMYYPARVPAMLNLPPKLSKKPRAGQKNERRPKLPNDMMESNSRLASPPEPTSHTWLPDPVASHRHSFAALSSLSLNRDREGRPSSNGEHYTPASDTDLQAAPDAPQRPRPLSTMDTEKRKSRGSFFKMPPQLRASAFFELSSATREVEAKDGSAMAALDSILDASASAPVSAFTDHVFAGKLGTEVYGKKKKHRAHGSAVTLGSTASPEPRPKKRASLMWLRKRSSSYNSEEKSRPRSIASAPLPGANNDVGHTKPLELDSGSGDENFAPAAEAEPELHDESGFSEEDEAYRGPPTTLLAELQLRKQEQQQRKKNFGSGFPNGIHATLLEMDTVAETQRKHRQTKRVNLAWEESGAHADQNGSDDEDVPLAILAAMQQGAKNRADLEQPMGLMERRELEDNEPLSRRRARLQGLDSLPMGLHKRQSVMPFPALKAADNRSPRATMILSPVPKDGAEDEGEMLGQRRRRLAEAEGNEGQLPLARPVSGSFSAELLSQFGDLEQVKTKPATGAEEVAGEVEETLGERRRRLQAEKEAREREMSHGALMTRPAPRINRRLSMADILAAHPKKETDTQAREERKRAEESRAAMEREAKMAAVRKQMPQSLAKPNVDRAGGFRDGAYNDGSGGCGTQASRSSLALNTHSLAHGPYGSRSRFSTALLTCQGGGLASQPKYGAPRSFGLSPKKPTGFEAMNATTGRPYGTHPATMAMYGRSGMGSGMQISMAMSTGSVDRVEQWRRSVRP